MAALVAGFELTVFAVFLDVGTGAVLVSEGIGDFVVVAVVLRAVALGALADRETMEWAGAGKEAEPMADPAAAGVGEAASPRVLREGLETGAFVLEAGSAFFTGVLAERPGTTLPREGMTLPPVWFVGTRRDAVVFAAITHPP